MIRLTDGRIVGRPGPVQRGPHAFARSPDSTLLYFAGAETYSERELVAFDIRSLQVTWRESLSALELRSSLDSLELLNPYATAVSPDAQRLLVAPARRKGIQGIAVLDAATHVPVDFLGPLIVNFNGIAAVPASVALPSGGIAVAGVRESGLGPKDGWLFLFDGLSLALVDSAKLTSGVDNRYGGLGQVVASTNARDVYIKGPAMVFRYDVLSRSVVGTASAPAWSRLSLAPDGSSLYACDPGDQFDYAGSGILYRYSADLASVEPIDLRSAAVNGAGPTVPAVAISRDSRTIYALVGNPSVGPLFPGQPLRVLIVDVASKAILKSFRVGEDGAGPIFVR
ncbi:MAG: hypothetical protein ACRDIC_09515 [bacterium]